MPGRRFVAFSCTDSQAKEMALELWGGYGRSVPVGSGLDPNRMTVPERRSRIRKEIPESEDQTYADC